MSVVDERRVGVATDADVVVVRQQVRALGARLGFSSTDLVLLATAVSEVARNIVQYATRGEITFSPIERSGKVGIEITARDHGPGIPDLELAMQDAYSTGGGLGLGLPGTRRLMDEFSIESEVGMGTTVTMRKWVR